MTIFFGALLLIPIIVTLFFFWLRGEQDIKRFRQTAADYNQGVLDHREVKSERPDWALDGLETFGELLKANNGDLDQLADDITVNLVKFLNIQQGSMYLIDGENERREKPSMSVRACYGIDRKFLNNKIYKGEGLAGRVWEDREVVHITEVPSDYVRIASGLGEASPASVLIVPFVANDAVWGFLELVSLKTLEDFKIKFVKRLAETIARTIFSIHVNARTRQLLEESQNMADELRAQQELLRQNAEQMQATQEELAADEEKMRQKMEELQEKQEQIARDERQTANSLKRVESELKKIAESWSNFN
jgi:hypothetical protein